jgi:hypothetical protein
VTDRDISSAVNLFESLKAVLAHRDGDEYDEAWQDARHNLITEIHGWAIDESQPNGRVEAYVIVLAERLKDEDAANLTRLLTLIDGVVSVVPVENDRVALVGLRRFQAEIQGDVWDLYNKIRRMR